MLQSKVFVFRDKKEILDCLESADLSSRLTTRGSDCRVHVLPMMRITLKVCDCVCLHVLHSLNLLPSICIYIYFFITGFGNWIRHFCD